MFPRRRVEPLVKALAVRLYHQGLSLRRVCEVLGELGDGWRFSYEALRRWYLKAGMLLPRGRRRRRAIALDETVVKVVGAKNWLWSAVDAYSEEPLASYLSPQRSFVHTTLFLERVLERCENKPLVYTDNGPWYPWALELYGLRHRREASGRRNTVERWFNAIKARTKRFYNNFPFHSTLESVARWIDPFTALHSMGRGLS